MSDAAAFFDLDRTLMAGTSAFYFAKAAYREGMLPLPRLMADAGSALLFRLLGASDEKSEALRDRILASVAGTPQEDLTRFVPEVVTQLIEKVRPEAQALVDMHLEAGRDVWIISASPVEVVSELAIALGMTGGLGTESELIDGVYTGRLAAPFCYGEGKADRMHKLAAERGYDLSKCYAYSDSASDLPMMQIVGHPVAVNPDRPLTAVAHRRGWPVVEFARQAKRIARITSVATGSAALAGGAYALGRRHGARRPKR